MNELRWYLRHCWHRRSWTWLRDGADAVCDICRYRVAGAGPAVVEHAESCDRLGCYGGCA